MPAKKGKVVQDAGANDPIEGARVFVRFLRGKVCCVLNGQVCCVLRGKVCCVLRGQVCCVLSGQVCCVLTGRCVAF